MQPKQTGGELYGVAVQLIVGITGLHGFMQAGLNRLSEELGGGLIVHQLAHKQTCSPWLTQRVNQQAGICLQQASRGDFSQLGILGELAIMRDDQNVQLDARITRMEFEEAHQFMILHFRHQQIRIDEIFLWQR